MSGLEGGSWCVQDMKLGNEFFQLVSNRPLVAIKILTLISIVEMGGIPKVRIVFSDGTIIDGEFDGILFEKGSLKLDLHTTNDQSIKVEPFLVKEILVLEQDSEHITEQSIERSLKLDLEIDRYFQERKVGGGGVS